MWTDSSCQRCFYMLMSDLTSQLYRAFPFLSKFFIHVKNALLIVLVNRSWRVWILTCALTFNNLTPHINIISSRTQLCLSSSAWTLMRIWELIHVLVCDRRIKLAYRKWTFCVLHIYLLLVCSFDRILCLWKFRQSHS